MVNSVRTRASKRSDQNLVWETVDSYASFLACSSPTPAMEDVASAAAPEVAALVEGLEPVDGQRGVLVVTAGGVVALHLFDKPSTLAAYWDGLLAGYALDAVDRRGGACATGFGPADARAYLDHVLGSPATETGAVALWTEVHFGDDDVTGGALVWDARSSTSQPSAGRLDGAGEGPDLTGRAHEIGGSCVEIKPSPSRLPGSPVLRMAGVLPRRNWGRDLMFLLMLAVALFAALFVVVLPVGFLLVALIICHRKTDEPELRLCIASDVTDAAAKPCFTPEGTRYCERHQALEQAS